jgi:hypothetical protein
MSVIDRIFIGKVVKDFGILDEKSLGLGKIKHSAFLVEKYGRLYFVIKTSAWALFGGSVSYDTFLLDDALKIRDFVNESQQILQNSPPLPYDVSRIAFRYSILTMAVASIANLLFQDSGYVFLTTFIAMVFFHAGQFVEFANHPDVDSKTKKWLIFIPLLTLLIGILKIFWVTWALHR